MKPMIDKPRNRKSGVALVIVLGFLSLMIVLAVSFAVTMRTERLAARSFADTVRAEQLVHTALGRAMDDIDEQMRTGGVFLNANRFYPDFKVSIPMVFSYSNDRMTGDTMLGRWLPQVLSPNFPLYTNMASNVRWVSITADSGGVTGKVAWFALDASGLLDPNFIHRVNRLYGQESGEITLDPAVFDTINNPNTFKVVRDNLVVRFDTPADMFYLGVPASLRQPYYLMPHSYSLPGAMYNNSYVDAEFLDPNPNQWDMNKVRNGFLRSGFNPMVAMDMANLLKDYVDADFVPYDLNKPSVEPVPMIAELGVQAAGSTTYVRGEILFPFVGTFNESYTINGTVTINGGDRSFSVPAFSPNVSDTPDQFSVPVSGVTNAAGVAIFKNVEVVHSGGQTVDQVPTLPSVAIGSSLQCDDPRFNHRTAEWVIDAPSYGAINANVSANAGDGDRWMFAANRELRTVGELGCLPVDSWETVKLYGPDLNPVINYFTLTSPTQPRGGLVNPNSPFTNVVASVFVDMPIDSGPGTASTQLGAAEALQAGQNLAAYALNTTLTNRADVGYAFNRGDLQGLGGTTELKREAFIRNTAELWSTRQNLFVIYLAAQVNTGGEVMADNRAYAVVWRDPFPNNNNKHRMVVRFFKWL